MEIKHFLTGLDDSINHVAARACIERITPYNYSFTDSSSVSTRQLLALAWAAIHDSDKCTANLEDRKALFIEALYEIQRGYNIDEHNVDDGGEDKPICAAGTFNKLLEKLNGIHEDVHVYYITQSGASAKFPILAKEQALAYLQSLSNPLLSDN